MTAIVVDELTKRFGDFAAVDGVSFEVPEGQLVAVLGPNGAGKTTTLEMLEGFLAPTSGSVRVLGTDPHRGDRRWRARIGLVLQSTSLDAEITVRETLTVFAGLYPSPRPVGEVLELVDLDDDAETRVGVLRVGSVVGSTLPSVSSAGPKCSSSTSPRPVSTLRPAGEPGPRSRT
jgi:ABC-2 type transport system ATP-binding protein